MPTINEVARTIPGHKSNLVAYLLWFFLGTLGGHRFYVGKWVTALIMVAITLGTGVLYAMDFGFYTAGILGIWLLFDLFFIPSWVENWNAMLLATQNVKY